MPYFSLYIYYHIFFIGVYLPIYVIAEFLEVFFVLGLVLIRFDYFSVRLGDLKWG